MLASSCGPTSSALRMPGGHNDSMYPPGVDIGVPTPSIGTGVPRLEAALDVLHHDVLDSRIENSGDAAGKIRAQVMQPQRPGGRGVVTARETARGQRQVHVGVDETGHHRGTPDVQLGRRRRRGRRR